MDDWVSDVYGDDFKLPISGKYFVRNYNDCKRVELNSFSTRDNYVFILMGICCFYDTWGNFN